MGGGREENKKKTPAQLGSSFHLAFLEQVSPKLGA